MHWISWQVYPHDLDFFFFLRKFHIHKVLVSKTLTVKTSFSSTWKSYPLAHDNVVRIISPTIKRRGFRSRCTLKREKFKVRSEKKNKHESSACPLEQQPFFSPLGFCGEHFQLWHVFHILFRWGNFGSSCPAWHQQHLWNSTMGEAAVGLPIIPSRALDSPRHSHSSWFVEESPVPG